ncbi:uncharacterized protein LOC101851373 [Aplysia californica]|uniref:Uncharacterized protein LOC101851373 n=1 Tax=Aplysia californica TaxID=6500 RepID=A0ABM0K6X9_APLCA|nr:uncharacterized protein LOC101851373 [Aplysia californica]
MRVITFKSSFKPYLIFVFGLISFWYLLKNSFPLDQELKYLKERELSRHFEASQSCSYHELAGNTTNLKLFSNVTFTSRDDSSQVVEECTGKEDPENLFLYKGIKYETPVRYSRRSYSDAAAQPDSSFPPLRPGDVPETVHYIWCGKKQFRFENYLSVLSAVKFVQPHKFIFHFYDLPDFDEKWYHTWFIELKQSLPSLELKKSDQPLPCEGNSSLVLALEQLAIAEEGGIYIGENTILTHLPSEWKDSSVASHLLETSQPNSPNLGVLMAKPGVTLEQLKTKTSESSNKIATCKTIDEFNQGLNASSSSASSTSGNAAPCVVVSSPIFPRDVVNSLEPFAALARCLYYGNASIAVAKQDINQVIPRIGHLIYFHKNAESQWPFYAYLSALSALYIAGIERLFIYGDKEPSGEWWDRLQGENITFIPIEQVHTVFQQPVRDIHHKTDILRYFILWKYGGVYMDYDIIWANPIPSEHWYYPTVAGVDWPKMGDWPEYFNMGALLSKPGAVYMKHVINSFRYYLDNNWGFNALMLPYRAYEQFPESVFIDHRLQASLQWRFPQTISHKTLLPGN